ncbi:MAG TPA: hypothetical protein VFA18_17245 [Gemmataceae bacterium]|nr:hypothetical protein [Gemmataceae bacterium]
MTGYIVYRHGWNDTNQKRDSGLPEKMAVARVEAPNADEACRMAVGQVTLAPGQYLSAEPAEPVDDHVANLSLKAEALEHPAPGS